MDIRVSNVRDTWYKIFENQKKIGLFNSLCYWNHIYQRRNQRQAVRLEKTEPVMVSAKNPPMKPASCAALQRSDCKKVFFIS
jgi:hypothetical protein